MNHIDDRTLQAYVDGELDAAGAAHVQAAMARDDAFARRVQQARALREGLRAVFDPVLDEPVPAHLSALLTPEAMDMSGPAQRNPTGDVQGFGAGRRRAPRRWLGAATALAASLAVVAVSLSLWRGNEPVTQRDAQLFASGVLSDALDHALASEPDTGAAVVIGLTFRQADGQVCRTFVQHQEPTMAGLACHGDGGWVLKVLSATNAAAGELRQAASGLPVSVQAAVDANLQGDAFDAAQERAARDAGWR
ncbi:MAG: anti-sigma factor family protein [Thermomonas sp.]